MSSKGTRILVDALCVDAGGNETYLVEMLPRLANYPLDLTVLVSQGRGSHLRQRVPESIKFVEAPRWSGNPFGRAFYQRISLRKLIRNVDPDVLWIPSGLTNFRKSAADRFKVVQLLRNMLPFNDHERLRYSLWRDPYQRLRVYLLSKALVRSFSRADRMIFISEYSARMVAPRVNAKGYHLVPHGLAGEFLTATPADEAWLTAHGIRKPFFLYVSRVDPYKHQDKLLTAFKRYRELTGDRKAQLVFVGPAENAYARDILAQVATQTPDVIFPGKLPRKDLPSLMAAAEVLLFASTCETCPNILIEYMGAGRPVITTTAPPMPEFAGDAARLVDAEKPEEWAAALQELMQDPQQREDWAKRARQRARLFSWDETARKTFAALTTWEQSGK